MEILVVITIIVIVAAKRIVNSLKGTPQGARAESFQIMERMVC